ncbi:hypothetical protein H0O02_02370 [Candidatus Micrarchaeota archaeon]|nr:hypothetical protein [Candidatus Micrarchaeota archaeon]
MENRLKKIEQLLAEHEKRLLALEGASTVNTEAASTPENERLAITFDDNDRPRFNVVLPSSSREEIQRTAILLLLHAKRESEVEMSTKKVSALLYLAGVDTTGIDHATQSLKDQKPALIASKPGKRTIILTQQGEEEAIKYAKQLKRK